MSDVVLFLMIKYINKNLLLADEDDADKRRRTMASVILQGGCAIVHVQTIIASGSSLHELPTPAATNPLYLFDHDPLIVSTVKNMRCLDHYFECTQFVF